MPDELSIAGMPRRKAKVSAVAKLLGVTRLTIYRWIDAGRLRCYRVSDRVSFLDLDEVERMIAERNPPQGGAQ
jgi:excisionase family DNA binding protein